MYLKEIGKVKLLDAALEVELAERILAGTEAERWRLQRTSPGTSQPDRRARPTNAWCARATTPRSP